MVVPVHRCPTKRALARSCSLQASAEPVKLGDNDDLDLSRHGGGDEFVESGSGVLCARDTRVDVLTGHGPVIHAAAQRHGAVEDVAQWTVPAITKIT